MKTMQIFDKTFLVIVVDFDFDFGFIVISGPRRLGKDKSVVPFYVLFTVFNGSQQNCSILYFFCNYKPECIIAVQCHVTTSHVALLTFVCFQLTVVLTCIADRRHRKIIPHESCELLFVNSTTIPTQITMFKTFRRFAGGLQHICDKSTLQISRLYYPSA